MAFTPRNLATKAFLMKFVELVMGFIVFLLFRCGNKGDMLTWTNDVNSVVFGIMVYTGYFFIVLVMTIGIIMGDKAHFTNLLFNIFGFVFFIAIGATQINFYRSLYDPVFIFIVFMMFRVGAKGDIFPWGFMWDPTALEKFENDFSLGILTCTGYFFIVLTLLVGTAMGDSNIFTHLLFNAFGFLFFISIGSVQISEWSGRPETPTIANDNPAYNVSLALGMGSMAIITGVIFLVDTVFSVLDLLNA